MANVACVCVCGCLCFQLLTRWAAELNEKFCSLLLCDVKPLTGVMAATKTNPDHASARAHTHTAHVHGHGAGVKWEMPGCNVTKSLESRMHTTVKYVTFI